MVLADLLVSKNSEFIAAYPELKSELNALRGSCVGCAARRLSSKIRALGQRDGGSLPDYFFRRPTKEEEAKAYTLDPSSGNVYEGDVDDSGETAPDGCLDCVLKHLSRALVLLEESELGYPQHRDLAVNQVGKALEGMPDDPDLIRIAASINAEGLEGVYAKAVGLIHSKQDGAAGGKERWMAIGHMCEAESECVAEDRGLAESIRQSRILLMGGSRPALRAMLTQIEGLRDRKAKREAMHGPGDGGKA